MIYVEMYGRLGNQMFRYAIARKLQVNFYPDEEICISFNQINEIATTCNDLSWKNELKDFKINGYVEYNKSGKVIFNETSLIQKIICFLYYIKLKKLSGVAMNETVQLEKKFADILIKTGVYWFRYGNYQLKHSNFHNKFVSGSFENPEYFDDIKDLLVEEFTPAHDILPKNKNLYCVIEAKQSICVSIRRGDFVNDEKIGKTHNVCTLDYYHRAIEYMKRHILNPVFVMFSDDISWVKENIMFEDEDEVVYEDGTDPVWEKLRMMYSCKHFIISNSSFSWWAQYLSRNDSKIVVSPVRWYNNTYESGLIQSTFVKIE